MIAIMLTVTIFKCYAECLYVKRHYAECRGAIKWSKNSEAWLVVDVVAVVVVFVVVVLQEDFFARASTIKLCTVVIYTASH
jgi:hypothetical protein